MTFTAMLLVMLFGATLAFGLVAGWFLNQRFNKTDPVDQAINLSVKPPAERDGQQVDRTRKRTRVRRASVRDPLRPR